MAGVTNGALAKFADMTDTSLLLPPGLARDDWEQIGETLRRIETGVSWWLADWWRFGEREYGESASQAAPTGLAAKTLANYAAVADRIEPSRRREDLTMGHHAAVAGLEDPDVQDEWLDKAAANDMSVAELRGRIKHANQPVDVPTEAVKLLRRAAEAFRNDPETAAAPRADFMDLADEAWQYVHGLTAAVG
jgi:hypothetical protein